MNTGKDYPIPPENPNVRAIVDALADWIAHRRASKDYGSLIGEIEEGQASYENGQSDPIFIQPSRLSARHGRRGQS